MQNSFYKEVKPEVADYLNSYSGSWYFLLDVKRKFQRFGKLSFAQANAVERAMARDAERNKVLSGSEKTFKAGDIIGITKKYAEHLSRRTNHNPFFRNLVVTKVHEETNSSVTLSVMFNSELAFSCNVCGRALDNEISQACGIGPVCYGKLSKNRPSISRAKEMIKEIEAYSRQVGEIGPFAIPKYAIKEKKHNELAGELFGELL